MKLHQLAISSLPLLTTVTARCYDPAPAYPAPKYSLSSNVLQDVFRCINNSIDVALLSSYPTSSFSIEITSSQETFWSYYHTARERDESRLGASVIDADSLYRIASITKVFTVLGVLQQHAAGNLSLDDPVKMYIEEFQDEKAGGLPWHSITLRSLASQLSGIPREFTFSDLVNELPDPTVVGLPPMPRRNLTKCQENDSVCGRKDFLDNLETRVPLFAPNWKSTYSNIAFNILGLVLENVTGMSYSQYMKTSIFDPLNLNSTFLDKPDDTHAVLPKGNNYWDNEEGVQRPTGGIYSSASDLSRFMRYVLTHYNGITPATNWFQPASYASGMNSFFGMPWEIYRTTKIVHHSHQPVTFVTKSGGLPGYFSIIIMVPDLDLGMTILVGGDMKLLEELKEVVTGPMISGAAILSQSQAQHKYAGEYTSTDPTLNTSLLITGDSSAGLQITRFISNNTDVLASPLAHFGDPEAAKHGWRALLTPTLLYRNQTAQKGELWRMLIVPDREEKHGGIWDEFCVTDVDPASYAGVPLTEIVFWDGEGDQVREVELSAFRVRLRRRENGGEKEGPREGLGRLIVQG